MYLPIISPAHRKRSFYSKPSRTVVSRLDGLPQGHDQVTTYGSGGGEPIKIVDGFSSIWLVGGGERAEVFGNGSHPTKQVSQRLIWGFWPITPSPDLHRYYQSYGQNMTRPGGELVEMKITPINVLVIQPDIPRGTTRIPTPSFVFVSDNYTAGQVRNALDDSGFPFNISDLTSFNSTGNLQQEAIVQFYRGDTAAVFLLGYDNTVEPLNNPNLVPNPPFPPGMSADAWLSINETIGSSIPLMQTDSLFLSEAKTLLFVLLSVFTCFLIPVTFVALIYATRYCCLALRNQRDHRGTGPSHSKN